MDRLEFLKLKRKDILETLNDPTLTTAEHIEYMAALEGVNKEMDDERIKRLKGTP